MLTIEKALNAYAKMMNNLSVAHLEPLLVHIRTHHEHLFLSIVNTDSYRT